MLKIWINDIQGQLPAAISDKAVYFPNDFLRRLIREVVRGFMIKNENFWQMQGASSKGDTEKKLIVASPFVACVKHSNLFMDGAPPHDLAAKRTVKERLSYCEVG